ncbi:hypothetical protein SLEP1_g16682 [Rubroshorea leprosula]|uniref:RING-type domain-containing protein n=1 Tax=Rubroshorea leprosula TaxID=152421 RepID=A0AAV5IXG8_9ROSI|nr:hypothetical protein SLEP1_g16682 [Rubroshorea leprosula]
MYRPVLMPYSCHSPRWRWRQTWGRLIALLTIWICASVSLRYGYYGDRRMVLGPSSSRLIRASSLFVEQVEARDDERKGVLLYGFSEKPELSQETNWSASNYLIVGSQNRKEFSLWLNKGSKIRMRWETQTSRLDQLQVIMIKGEQKHAETLLPHLTSSFDAPALSEPLSRKDTEYTIEEDNKYNVRVTNKNHRSINISMTLNVTSRMYDLTKAKNICSTQTGSCQLKLRFPNTQFLVLTTPDNVDVGGWYIELSFVARVITYIAILGFFIAIIFWLLKYLGACDAGESVVDTAPMEIQYDYDRTIATETTPMLTEKHLRATYGTGKEREDDDETGSSSSSSEDLYDAKLCVICYDDQRNCFFVPCGHCATCYNCAQRILSEDNKMCPICRRLIHKVRRLFTP